MDYDDNVTSFCFVIGQLDLSKFDTLFCMISDFRDFSIIVEATYKTVEEVASALKRREVRGALVDVYSAATRSDLFKHSDIVAKKNMKYPSAYGFVLSGDMKNAAPKFRDYLKVHANSILKTLENSAAGLEVSFCYASIKTMQICFFIADWPLRGKSRGSNCSLVTLDNA